MWSGCARQLAHTARSGRRYQIRLSIALSALPAGRTVTLEELIDAADEGMYVDKQGKRESQLVWSI